MNRALPQAASPRCIWLTGLPCAGKTSLAQATAQLLRRQGRPCSVLDGDIVRHGLCRDLGYSEADRVENIRRVAEVARLMLDAGLVVIVALISPFDEGRRLARSLIGEERFSVVFVDAPLAVCEGRDAKGMYARARRGELPQFTGIDSPYQAPLQPELRVDTHAMSVDACAAAVYRLLAPA